MNLIESYRRHFDYDAATGLLTWRVPTSCRSKVGDVVGFKTDRGYLKCRLNKKLHSVHRLIYELYTGTPIPDGMQIDHINNIRDDNRISNLRLVTAEENTHNRYDTKKNGTFSATWYRSRGLRPSPEALAHERELARRRAKRAKTYKDIGE